MTTATEKRQRLRERLAAPGMLTAPGIFDMISARMADRMGFDVLYMTGYGTVASYLGLPDAGLATYTDMLNRASAFALGTQTPIIADGDTGYGGLLNVAHTVKGYEAGGLAGIQLEDQEFPKKCGHTPGRRVIPASDMVKKIRVAAEARNSDDFLIVARTDARTSLGLDEALSRMHAYSEAGADILFVESPESVQEMEQIAGAFDKPVLINIVEGGKTPVLSREQLQAMGFRLAIYPGTAFLAMGKALEDAYSALLQDGSSAAVADRLYDFESFSRLMGFQAVWDFDKAHADD
ncbi:carboxyvinyl-carboxyphosphonate phosphorylmutase [Pollutimonas thiosulfatoxidans]|uniref:Carboxyvinyl-carboxyphosphonate phosphorylmutase n=2 Tax=Pollutimonas thiosulfatoxidans TaxID=2028345 RepID=A0A410GBS5_9BURK|nr:isocitrate lyase/PEP mutase family protein [Pollutimonas thiosulfatoxidans]QAA93729.1 carboxyvinyl-carboxyphosphonate phosphorylmutase [Pollutimonas thiosulfatoxidans]